MMSSSASFWIESFHDPATASFTHLLVDRVSRRCAVIDPVLGFDMRTGRVRFDGADRIAARIVALDAQVDWLLETHVHADHLSAAAYLRRAVGGKIGIGMRFGEVRTSFEHVFDKPRDAAKRSGGFDHLFADAESFTVGTLRMQALHTPGHTPACTTYVVRDDYNMVAFVGDTLFMPDIGTARCDFPGGDALTLYQSIQRIFTLPASTRLYMCHDEPPAGRTPQPLCTVGDQRARNVHVRDGVTEVEFAKRRAARDATLALPALMIVAVQVNLDAGELPLPAGNGIRYLRLPLDVL
jgi:glyoxylase-like metal-dependent hydrolase (beta-lactamase superfamily II)